MMKREAIYLPDLGVSEALVVSLWIAPGETVSRDQALLSIESDKAQLDVPSPFDGESLEWAITEGQRISAGQLLGYIMISEEVASLPLKEVLIASQPLPVSVFASVSSPKLHVYAGPGVRRMARELNVDLARVVGSASKGRVTKSDVSASLKKSTESSWRLSPTQRASQAHLTQVWQTIPHVTHGDRADITELEDIRLNAKKQGMRFSVLPFVMKAVALALCDHPKISSRLSKDLSELVFFSAGGMNVAVDSEDGLRVPRLDGVDQLTLKQLIESLNALGARARSGKMSASEMSPGSITVTSLGGIGGEWFTPIINAPQIAIVGVMKASWMPIWKANAWVPKLMLPLVVSYDHRAIDGVEAQRFLNSVKMHLEALHRSSWVQL